MDVFCPGGEDAADTSKEGGTGDAASAGAGSSAGPFQDPTALSGQH